MITKEFVRTRVRDGRRKENSITKDYVYIYIYARDVISAAVTFARPRTNLGTRERADDDYGDGNDERATREAL